MNDQDVELYLNRIFTGILYFYFKNEQYELRSAPNHIKYQGSLIYNNIINEEKYNEWIREENLIPVMINLGLWQKDTDKLITKLEKKIEDSKVELYKNSTQKDNLKKIRKNLTETRESMNNILSKKNEFMNHTLEGYAMAIKNEYIICNTIFKNNKKVFDSTNRNTSSYTDFNDIVNEINHNTINMDQLKFLARSSMWRSYWNANKNNVFSTQVIDWTDDQRNLVNITKMYDNIYENEHCPPDSIINDDDMLDGWMILQRRKREKEKTQQSIDELNPNLKNANEVFLFANNNESYEEITSLNSAEASARLKEKMNYIKTAGTVDDSKLPDVQRELLQQRNDMLKNRK
jgi:hypothetical protein